MSDCYTFTYNNSTAVAGDSMDIVQWIKELLLTRGAAIGTVAIIRKEIRDTRAERLEREERDTRDRAKRAVEE